MSHCIKCGHEITLATNVDGSDATPPHAGAIAICYECGHVMIFESETDIRELTTEEQLDVLQDRDVLNALISIAIARRTTLQ